MNSSSSKTHTQSATTRESQEPGPDSPLVDEALMAGQPPTPEPVPLPYELAFPNTPDLGLRAPMLADDAAAQTNADVPGETS